VEKPGETIYCASPLRYSPTVDPALFPLVEQVGLATAVALLEHKRPHHLVLKTGPVSQFFVLNEWTCYHTASGDTEQPVLLGKGEEADPLTAAAKKYQSGLLFSCPERGPTKLVPWYQGGSDFVFPPRDPG